MTAFVVTVNVTLVWPAGIVTVVGTVAEVWLLANVITLPPAGAGPEMMTVPVDEVPPFTEVGLTLTLDTVGGVIVNWAVSVMPKVALMFATV